MQFEPAMEALAAWLLNLMTALESRAAGFGLIVTVLLAFLGYLISHWSTMARQRAEARLEYVSRQLEHLYGPLYSLVQSNTASWRVFRQTFRKGEPLIDKSKPFDERERLVWKAWAENVFIPSNLKIRDTIERNAHLLVDGVMPECFVRIIAHIESSKLVLASLDIDDLAVLDAFAPWPKDFNDFVEAAYSTVAQEHARLLGRSLRLKQNRAPSAPPKSAQAAR